MDAELKQQFDDMGIEPSQDVVDKCKSSVCFFYLNFYSKILLQNYFIVYIFIAAVELCISYHIDDAAEFVEQWLAFSVSHLSGAEPTLEYLNEFERKVFHAKREKDLLAANKRKTNKLPAPISNLSHLNSLAANSSNPLAMYGVEDDMFDDYMPDMVGAGSSTALNNSEIIESNTPNIYHTPKVGQEFVF